MHVTVHNQVRLSLLFVSRVQKCSGDREPEDEAKLPDLELKHLHDHICGIIFHEAIEIPNQENSTLMSQNIYL